MKTLRMTLVRLLLCAGVVAALPTMPHAMAQPGGTAPGAAATAASPQDLDDAASVRAVSDWIQSQMPYQQQAMDSLQAALPPIQALLQAGSSGGLPAVQASAPQARQALLRAQVQIRQARAGFERIGPLAADARVTASWRTMAAVMHRDNLANFAAVDTLVFQLIELLDAVEAGRRDAIERLGPAMMSTSRTLVDASRLQIEGRRAMLPATDTAHHTLGALAAYYASMSALLAGEGPSAASIDGAADAYAAWVASGRATLAAQRGLTLAAPPEVAPVLAALHDSYARGFAIDDSAIAILRRVEASLAGGRSDPRVIGQALMDLGALEFEMVRLGNERVVIARRLAGD
jgi:hypothetical protein